MRAVKVDGRDFRFRWRAAVTAVVMILGLVQLRDAEAAVFVVNSTADPATGSAALCAAGNAGTCTLRDAIAAAAAAGGNDVITFSVGANQTITLTSVKTLTLNSNVMIDASDSPNLAIDGNSQTRVFVINNGVTASMQGLSVRHGHTSVFLNGYNGGGIVNNGTLVLTACVVSGNGADDGGGGIFNTGSLTLEETVVSGNTSGARGGGIWHEGGNLTLIRSTVSANASSQGAGIYSQSPLSIQGSSITDNAASTFTGAIFAEFTLTIVNSTISGNSAATYGGIYSTASGLFVNVTLAGNSGATAADYADFNDGKVTLKNTIVGDCKITSSAATPVTDGGGNLDGGSGCLGAVPAQVTSHSNATLNLGPLQDNGGPTLTRLPGPGSAALEGGVDGTCIDPSTTNNFDQRGTRRPQQLHCDVGAVEVVVPCYVNASATGLYNGTSWTDAYKSLQSALTDIACTETWVAKGTYKPTTGNTRTSTFNVRPFGVLRGGFAGNETTTAGRDFIANASVLSGDIGIPNNAADNSYHVVTIDGTTAAGDVGPDTILDGFTIIRGHAADDPANNSGGGLACLGSGHDCSPVLENLTFIGNSASYGGGLYHDGTYGTSNPKLSNVRFSGNSAVFDGGAIYSWGAHGIASPVVTNATFDGNTAAEFGGALFLDGTAGASSGTWSNAVFTNNTAVGMGGAICNWGVTAGDSSPALNGVTFAGNSGEDGGAIANHGLGGKSSPTLTDVTFAANTATQRGGAMFSDGSAAGVSNPTLQGVTFAANTANNGGALYNFGQAGQSNVTLTNVTLSFNIATSSGGGMFNDGANGVSQASLDGVTFYGNDGGQSGGAIVNSGVGGNGNPTLTNVILWNDKALANPEISNNTTVPAIDHSIVKGSHGSGGAWDATLGTDGGGNLDVDPLLGALQYNGGPTVTMMPGFSFGLNAGSNNTCPSTDQRGVPRPQPAGGNCDIGSVERRAFEDNIFNSRFEVF